MPKKLKFFVSSENKILLHLKRYTKVEPTKKVPQEIIQVGIANTLGSPRGSVSRALGNLIGKGLVEEKLCRVEASKRRMNAYFLTWEGRSQVDELEQKLAGELIEARAEDGSTTDVTIAEAIELSNDTITTSELLRIVELNGFYDPGVHKAGDVTAQGLAGAPAEPESVIRVSPTARVKKEAMQYSKIPPVRRFFGRKSELEQLSKELDDHLILIVKGMAGIGKTTIVAKLMHGQDPAWKIFWYRFQEWDTPKGVIQAMAEFFGANGRAALLNELSGQGTELDLFRLTRIISQEFQSMPSMMVFDDFHRASKNVKQLFTGLIEQLDPGSTVHLLFITRAHIPVYDQRDVNVKNIVAEKELTGLDRESAREMLGDADIPATAFDRLYTLTRGHPLALELIKLTGHVTDISDMMKFINEQVFQKLKKDERSLLSSISVHRKPAPIPAFLLEDEADFDTVDELINRAILVEAEPTRYEIHDLIKEFFNSRLIAKNRKRYHLHAAEYYSSTDEDDLNILEAVYHYINAKEQDKAAELMVTRAPSLISRGHLDEAMNILTKFDSTVSTEYLAKLYTLKGDILSTWGEWDNVFEYYWQCHFISMLDKVEEPKWQLLGSYGYIGWKPSEVEVAVANLNSSLDVLKESGDEDGVLEIENSLAWLNWMTGTYKDAVDIYKKIQKKMEKQKDTHGTAKILIKLGNVYWADNKLDQSLKVYTKGLEQFSNISDNNGIARTNSLLALVHIELGDHEKADEHLEQCIQLSEQRQFKKGLGYGLMHKAQQLILQGKTEDALSVLARAKEVFEVLNDSLGLGYQAAIEGYVYKQTNQFRSAIEQFESTLNHMRGFLMPYYKSRMYTELSNLYKLSGETEKAEEAQLHAIEKSEQKEE
jgi:tetratricopeptide (TPR) repeat protein/DNA-binding MarR family transcriptional regulator